MKLKKNASLGKEISENVILTLPKDKKLMNQKIKRVKLLITFK